MRRFLLPLLALVAVVAAGCSSDNFYRGRAETNGQGSAQAFRVQDGVETPITSRYTITGRGSATVQTVKPYLTLDGAWSADTTPGATGTVVEDKDAVVIRRETFASATQPGTVKWNGKPALLVPVDDNASCADGSCPVPATPAPKAAPPCAPPPAAAPPCTPVPGAAKPVVSAGRPCGSPVYRGCSGVEGGNRPEPIGNLIPRIAPGTGWPCTGAQVVGAVANGGKKVVGVIALPVGWAAHAVGCLVGAIRCAFYIP